MEDDKGGWKSLLRRQRTLSRHSELDAGPELDSSPGAAPEVYEWPLGTLLLGLYEIRGVHRGGGMGLVYRVHHLKWDIDLALKQPRAAFFKTSQQIQTFRTECDTWVRLGLHPHIASCYYVRLHDGVPLVFAEYLEGGSLEEWIDRRTLYLGGPERALERILDISLQAGCGLAYSHSLGLKHRDVKPANIVLTPDGVAKLTDFGLAAATGVSDSTPGYRSPEQADALPLSNKTDVWSWAVSVLEMFAGGLAWPDGKVADRALHRWDPRDVPEFVPALPGSVSEVLVRCLGRKAEGRPSMADALGDLLTAYEAVVGRAYPRIDIRDAISQKDFKQSTVTASGDLSNRALSFLDLAEQDSKKRYEAEEMLRRWLEKHPRDPVPWCNLELLRLANGRTTISVLARDYFEIIAPKRPDWEELGVEPGRFLQLASSHSLQTDQSPVVRTRWRGLDRTLFTACANGSIWLWAIGHGGWERVRSIREPGIGISDIWLDSDERIFVGLQDGTLELRDGLDGRLLSSACLMNARSDRELAETELSGNPVRSVSRSSGDAIIVGLENQQWFVLSLPDLGVLQSAQPALRPIRVSGEPADGRYRVVGEHDGVVRFYGGAAVGALTAFLVPKQSVSLVEPLSQTSPVSAKVQTLRVSPDGKWVACGTKTGALFLWQPELAFLERKVSPQCWVYAGPLTAIAFSHDSTHLYFSDAEGWVRVIALDSISPLEVVQIRLSISCLEVSPDDSELVIGCSTGTILFHPLSTSRQDQLPFLITRPRSSEEHTRLIARRYMISQDARGALEAHRFADAYSLAKSGIELAGGDAEAEDQFREVLLALPARRVGLREWRLRWSSLNVYGSMTATRAGPTVNGLAHGSGQNVLVVGTDEGLHRLRVTDGGDLERLEIPHIRAISYDKASNSCVAALDAGKVALMYFDSLGQIVQSPEHGSFSSIVRLSGGIRGIAACGSSSNGTVVFWHGHDVFEWLDVMPSGISALAVSADSTWLAIAGTDGIVGCLDIAQLNPLTALHSHRSAIRALAFDQAGQWLASAGDDGRVHVWNVRSASLMRIYPEAPSRIHALAFSPDGDWLASGHADGEIRILRIGDDAQTVLRLHKEELSALSFDSVGGALYCGYRFGGICRWDLDWELDLSPSEIHRAQDYTRAVVASSMVAPRPETSS